MKKTDKPGYIDRLLLLEAFDDAKLPITKSERTIINSLPTIDDDPYTTRDIMINLNHVVADIRKNN